MSPGHTRHPRPSRRRRRGTVGAAPRAHRVAGLLTALTVLVGCGGGAGDTPGADEPGSEAEHEVVLVSSAAARDGFEAVLPLFAEAEDGADVEVVTSYGPSAGQSRKVADGMGADVVSFSVAPDMTRLVDEDVVDPSWADDATAGVPFASLVVLVVRGGDGPEITDWADLLAPGVEVVTPDPRSSGAAMWNLLAAYAAFSDGGADPEAGFDQVTTLIDEHIRTRPASARAATELFLQGTGDVLIAFEQEARAAIEDGADIAYTVPEQTVSVEHTVAVTGRARAPEQARALVDFLFTLQAQEAVAAAGYRPVDPAVSVATDLPVPQRTYSIAELGGWPAVHRELFDAELGRLSRAYREATR